MPTYQVRNPKTLSTAIRDARRLAGVAVGDLADQIGTTPQYIYEIEAGKHPLWITRVFRLLRRLDIKVTVTYGEDDGRG